MSQSSFGSAYHLLVSDFLTVTEYINPSDANLNTYSHRLYEVLLRAATEFENLCKFRLRNGNYTKTQNLNINDYKTLEEVWEVEDKEVGILIWQPQKKYVKPFDNWTLNSPALPWYKAYNNVKHNREENFSCASFSNVIVALSALFLALEAEFGKSIFNPYEVSSSRRTRGSVEFNESHINNSIFTKKSPK